MYARSTTVQGDPQAMDDVIAYVRDEVAPLVGDLDGYVGISMICDRDSGRCIVTSTWATEGARQASNSAVGASRSRVAETTPAPTCRSCTTGRSRRCTACARPRTAAVFA